MIHIDEERVFSTIRERRPRVVAFNGPEALLGKISSLADKVSREFGIDAYVIADPCYGSCDLNTDAARRLNADILFHVGHSISMKEFGNVVMVDAYDDIPFDSVLAKCVAVLRDRGIRSVAVLTDSQHVHQVGNARRMLQDNGFIVATTTGKGQLMDAQVFGCEFYPAFYARDRIDAFLFLGQSIFHAVGIALSTNRLTLMLDPYYDEVREVNGIAEGLKRRALLAVYKALDAERIGLIVGLKEGQMMLNRVKDIKSRLEAHGRSVRLIALTEVTEERLRVFSDVDAFIQVACPRISIDDEFSRPVLSVPQAYTLLKLLDKQNIEYDEFLVLPHWL
ncbi:MAG: diphthamide biosynthesis enzyme Dph2 [Candidatus Nitrosocaldus sp.]|nr:diphthamide biosynthesis enzyme Dph2 [Candidatus Nitrosocaldus sp.]MDW8274930.1 diphthamide biosynthesis enzyme Dph2 [Candidatus Nitrosocaldus sp.]